MELAEGRCTVSDADVFVDTLREVGEHHDCAVQAFDATMIAGRDHLASAVAHADRAFERGENVARERAVEILLYAAGRRQIQQALALGVPEGTGPVVAVVDADAGVDDPGEAEAAAARALRDRLSLDPAPALGRIDEATVREFFEIGDAELAATDAGLEALVRERVALLDVEK